MKLRTHILLGLLLASQCLSIPFADASSNTKSVLEPAPTIRFLRPIKDEHFFDVPIYLVVEVTGFKLIPPTQQHTGTAPVNSGYIQYTMDDYPVVTTDDTQVMLGKKIGNGYLPVGIHAIRAQLVDTNGNALNPPVAAVTEIFSGHPAAIEVIHKTNDFGRAQLNTEQLYQMTVQLDELQKALRKIETGNSGYAPTPMNAAGQCSE